MGVLSAAYICFTDSVNITPEKAMKVSLSICSQAAAEDNIIQELTEDTNNTGCVSIGVNKLSRSNFDNWV